MSERAAFIDDSFETIFAPLVLVLMEEKRLERITSDVYLGLALAGLSTLILVGLFVVFR